MELKPVKKVLDSSIQPEKAEQSLDERDSTSINIQHSPVSNGNEHLQEDEEYIFDNDQSIGGCLLGREVADVNDALNLYKAHARAVGFTVRKGTSRRRCNSNVLFEKYFVCSKAGLRDKRKKHVLAESTENEADEISLMKESSSTSCQMKRKRRVVNVTRTDCKAYIRFKMNKEGRFVVVDHDIIHNHDFVKSEGCYHCGSDLTVSKSVGKVTERTVVSSIKPMNSYSYFCNEYKGEEVVGHTRADDLDFVSRFEMKNIHGNDMQNVLDVMQQRITSDASFFYGIKVNNKNQVSSLFWRDSNMLEDCIAYGDVLIFDTTYRTNVYNAICAPFIGINNHGKPIMFACAFIANEMVETFEWVLETFKKSMCGLVPKSIFTDQNLAMNNAIVKVFPTSRHRLCVWHLQKSFIAEFGSNPTFKDLFNKCLTGCHNEDEFTKCWTEMINTYGLQENFWFTRLYDLRDKWCTALSKDFFSRIISSQRLEVTNMAIPFRANKTTSLLEFYQIFEDTVKRWRNIEKNDNFRCPASDSPCKLLKHAAEIYTLDIFDDFKKEFDIAMGSYIRAGAIHEGFQLYQVSLNEDFTRSYDVLYNGQLLDLSCTCMSYQECGLLCYHLLRVMHMHCIFEIPQKYIMKRWTKLAKPDIWAKNKDDVLPFEDKTELHTLWHFTMAQRFNNLLTACQFDNHVKKVIEKRLNDMCKDVQRNLPIR